MAKFIIRGRVLRHETTSRGWWIFKERFDTLILQLDPQALEMAQINIGGYYDLNEAPFDIPSEIKLSAPKENRHHEKFPIGMVVDVTFEYARALEQFYVGRSPMAIVLIEKHIGDTDGPFRSQAQAS